MYCIHTFIKISFILFRELPIVEITVLRENLIRVCAIVLWSISRHFYKQIELNRLPHRKYNMFHQRALPQSKEALLKSCNKKLKDDVRSMLDNFTGEF